ncbi:hypothetical protein VTL71DRAFT_7350 [Oculimacula yallundae]|uniref:Heterokaryon incompatibility domain-containing protein n=1 Tax=Oculimacula yallundae TaxID=86028 RepID=A0ABR4BWE7_9HELO
MSRNDQISIDWHNATIKARTLNSETAVPACSILDLCDRCASLDLPKIFQKHIERQCGNFIIDLGHVDDLLASTCALCRLFGSVAPSDVAKYGAQITYHLRAISARLLQKDHYEPYLEGMDLADTTLLAVFCGGREQGDMISSKDWFYLPERDFLCPVQIGREEPHFGVRVLTESFDVDFVKKCMSHCRRYHRSDAACNALYEPVYISMQHFWLIDCTKRIVVKAVPGSPYAALSYVWGAPKHAPPGGSGEALRWPPKLESLPQTIDDCIKATLLVGFRYLWIDRYCINQSDSEQVQDQVCQMDIIYANAGLTIIAAAGRDPHYGLPGVNRTKRSLQRSLKIGDVTIVSKPPDPRLSLKESTWATRGWTYQEGLLSRRRLIFHPHQTYFECNNMHMAESEVMPLDVINMRKDVDYGFLTEGVFEYSNPGGSAFYLEILIAAYSGKILTHQEDALNAMAGIFRHFGKLKPPGDNLMGIPVVPMSTVRKYCPVECFLVGLSWYHTTPGLRRIEFPTWTWAGWIGALDSRWLLGHTNALGSDIHVWMEYANGHLSLIPKQRPWYRLKNVRLGDKIIKFIHIEARTFGFQLKAPDRSQAKIDLGEAGLLSYTFKPDQKCTSDETSSPECLTAIAIGDPSDTKLVNTMILCVKEKETFAERVGVLDSSRTSSTRFQIDDSDVARLKLRQFVRFLQALPKRTIRLG